MSGIARAKPAFSWQLRAAWATGEPVSVRYQQDALSVAEIYGWVISVATSGEYVHLRLTRDAEDEEPLHVPTERIASVTVITHFHDGRKIERRPRLKPRETNPDQLTLMAPPPVSSERAVKLAVRAAEEMLSEDLMVVLAAVDRAGKRPTLHDVAAEAGGDMVAVLQHVGELEARGYIRRVIREGRADLLLLA